MTKDRIGKILLVAGMLAWLWIIFAPDKLGGYLSLFTDEFSLSNFQYRVLWDAFMFLVVGVLALRFNQSNKIWWLEFGLLQIGRAHV